MPRINISLEQRKEIELLLLRKLPVLVLQGIGKRITAFLEIMSITLDEMTVVSTTPEDGG
jgi:hypothetical protein